MQNTLRIRADELQLILDRIAAELDRLEMANPDIGYYNERYQLRRLYGRVIHHWVPDGVSLETTLRQVNDAIREARDLETRFGIGQVQTRPSGTTAATM